MCIHCFADDVLSIPLLFEQIWLKPDYYGLLVDEVYDIFVTNEGKGAIDQFYILYPHDIVTKEDVDASIELIVPQHDSRFNWYHSERVSWTDKEEKELKVVVESGFESPQFVELTCRPLVGHVKWPTELEKTPELVALISVVGKTLFRIELSQSLAVHETGVLRLRISPKSELIKVPNQVFAKKRRGASHPHRFSWDLRVDSPDVLKNETKNAFRAAIKGADGKAAAPLNELRQIYRGTVRGDRSAVRVESHRVAVLRDGNVEITEQRCSPTILPVASIQAVWESSGRPESTLAHVWVGGSQANTKTDLYHTVRRVCDLLRHTDFHGSFTDIAQKLAVADQQEAMGVLLEEMEAAGILSREDEAHGLYRLVYPDPNDSQLRAAAAEVMVKYEQALRENSDTPHGRLYRSFRNLHPFTIDYHVEWECYHPDHSDELDQARQQIAQLTLAFNRHRRRGRWITTITIILAIMSVVVGVTSVWLTLAKG